MHGNRVATVGATAELSETELRELQAAAADVADSVRDHLTDAFAVESDVVSTPGGPQGAVSVQPPDAPPVAAGIPYEDVPRLNDDHRAELTIDLVATAVGRARTSVGDRILQAAQ